MRPPRTVVASAKRVFRPKLRRSSLPWNLMIVFDDGDTATPLRVSSCSSFSVSAGSPEALPWIATDFTPASCLRAYATASAFHVESPRASMYVCSDDGVDGAGAGAGAVSSSAGAGGGGSAGWGCTGFGFGCRLGFVAPDGRA